MGGPQGASPGGGLGDESGQRGIVRYREGDIGAAAAVRRAAVGPGSGAAVGEQPHIEGGQREHHPAPGIETGIYVLLAAALIAVTFAIVRRRDA